ncbi:MAG: glycoside hydrolase family 3 N-terminal domain-containing protein, partial [Turicibacter sp.]
MELIYQDSTKTIKERVQHLMSLMTLEEKVGQLHQMVSNEHNVLEACELARQGKLGSRILASTAFAGNETQVAGDGEINNLIQRVAMEESRLGIPVINGRDVIHGYRTVFPIPLAQAATFDCDLVQQACHISAKEAINGGVHWTFAPMIDVSRDARWGRIIESFGEDPFVNAKLGQASIKGYQGSDLSHQHAIAACAKHYIGYGASEGGRDYESVEISDNTLRNTYLKPFKAAVKSGVATVMSGFHENNGEPITASSYWLNDVLKDELGFDGFVISDWASVEQLIHQGVAKDRKDAAQIGLKAGVDMDMVSNCYLEYLVALVKEGKVKERVIDAACGKILTLKFKLGLFENPYTEIKPEQDVQLLPEHLKRAREIATKSIVLLKNKDNVLPLSKTDESVALVGPFSHERRALLGSWTLDGKASDVINLVEGVKTVAPSLDLRTCETALTDEMIACIRRANKVVVALGESHVRNGEANSVADIVLPPGQEELLEMISRFGKPIITIIFAGRPLDLTRVMRYSDAILYAWHPGVQGGLAVADILFGDVLPSGKLP